MMAITEEQLKEANEAEENSGSEEVKFTQSKLSKTCDLKEKTYSKDEFGNVPVEFMDLYNDEELKQTLIDLMLTASDLDILDFQVK
jgi:hypothetical protein